MQEIKDKVFAIILKYEKKLATKGIMLAVSKKYFETDVEERDTYHPNAGVRLLNHVDRHFDKKRERNYKYERNKYHCIILSVLPINKNLLQREYCKDYAFVLCKVERAHIGQEPQRITYEEDRVLSKIEKRILKTIHKAEKHSMQKVCTDTLLDAVRYSVCSKYEYKSKVLGKERSSWELIFLIAIGILAVAFVLANWGIVNLFC